MRSLSTFEHLSTAQVADAVVRLGSSPRMAPSGVTSISPGSAIKIVGPAAPVALSGFADQILEGIYRASAGDVLLLDNQGRRDEACFGDLAAYEARTQGLAGVVIWGVHRDTEDLQAIGVPVFSYGTYPLGMQRVYEPPEDPFEMGMFGDGTVKRGDIVFADADGVLFLEPSRLDEILEAAEGVRRAEAEQVEKIRGGTSLRDQLRFDEYLEAKKTDPALTLGEHMKRLRRHF